MLGVIHFSEFDFFEEFFSCGAVEGRDADEELISYAAKCSPINWFSMPHLEHDFRGKVLRRPTYSLRLEFSFNVSPRKSKISNPDVALFVNENIFWFKTNLVKKEL